LLVLDADALTLISQWPRWWERLPHPVILTPHPGEMARLTGGEEDRDRIALARRSAAAWNAVLVLKGAYTVVARPDGRAAVLPFATSALATAGTGDVLAGAIVGLLAQGRPAADAALAGAFVHGTAGEALAADVGSAGALAGDLARALPRAIRMVRASSDRLLPPQGVGW
jgi:hydroxyethylthiazole kinase-like uncharacterized protein yjeF